MSKFDISELEDLVDFFNVDTYDVHGPWDQPSLWDGPSGLVTGHANITDIESALDLLWRNGISSEKVVMGFTFMGRGFLLQDPTCSKPGSCNFAGPSFPSDCSNTRGIFSYQGKLQYLWN